MTLTEDRAERGRMVVESYGSSLGALLTDLHAYADTLGPAAFANNVQVACTRNGHKAPAFPGPEVPWPMSLDEYEGIHPDYKLTKDDGTRWALRHDPEGTCLVPVTITG